MNKKIIQIPDESILVKINKYSVFITTALESPKIVKTIGFLREQTFRKVGITENKSSDLDNFDTFYKHIVLWDNIKSEIVGAYRIGEINEILDKHGIDGLCTNRMFNYNSDFFNIVSPTLELGRAFIQPKYQNNYSCLALLWKGIYNYAAKKNAYRYLLGTVSIDNRYSNYSCSVIVEFLKNYYFHPEFSTFVKTRFPFINSYKEIPDNIKNIPKNIKVLNDFINRNEKYGLKTPVLLRKYIKIGGKIIGFAIDKNFNNLLDCLILIDITKIRNESFHRIIFRRYG